MNSVIIKADASYSVCNPSDTKYGFKLAELYAALNCYMVEVVYPTRRTATLKGYKHPILICDEEALFSSKQVNHIASLIAGVRIVGDVILTESKNFQ